MTLEESLNAQVARRAALIARNSVLSSLIISEQQSYQDWVAQNNWTEAKRHSDAVSAYDAERTGNENLIAGITPSIDALREALKATTAQATANAALTQAQASLSPEQLYQLQLKNIEADKQAEAEKIAVAAKAEADKKIYAQKNTQYLIIAGVVIAVLIIGVFAWKKFF